MWDEAASLPTANFDDLRDAGLLLLCVPRADGGGSAVYPTCMTVAAEIGRFCGAAALTLKMHTSSMLRTGMLADGTPMPEVQRSEHAKRRAIHFARVVRDGAIYAQPFSGGIGPQGRRWLDVQRSQDLRVARRGSGAPVKRPMYPTKQIPVAQMRIQLENLRSIFVRALHEAGPQPSADEPMRLCAALYNALEGANDIARLAIRTGGAQSMMKHLPLEQLYRDSQCGSSVLPWTAELVLDRMGREALYLPSEKDE